MVLQLDQAKKTRGERVEDGTAYRDRPLFEVLLSFSGILILISVIAALMIIVCRFSRKIRTRRMPSSTNVSSTVSLSLQSLFYFDYSKLLGWHFAFLCCCFCAHSLHLVFTGPPKALDDDETEFLDQWETVRLSDFLCLCDNRWLLRQLVHVLTFVMSVL